MPGEFHHRSKVDALVEQEGHERPSEILQPSFGRDPKSGFAPAEVTGQVVRIEWLAFLRREHVLASAWLREERGQALGHYRHPSEALRTLRLTHADTASLLVDVGPLNTADLSAAETVGREQERCVCARGGREQAADLFRFEDTVLSLVDVWENDLPGRVTCDKSLSYGVLEHLG